MSIDMSLNYPWLACIVAKCSHRRASGQTLTAPECWFAIADGKADGELSPATCLNLCTVGHTNSNFVTQL